MSIISDIFTDREGGGFNDRFYVLLLVLLTHIFYYKLFIPGQMIFGTDLQNQSYPIQVAIMREIFANGYVPQWNPYMSAGMPLLASFSFHIIYPGTWIFFFMPTYFAMGYLFVLQTMLMGVFFYYYAREIGLRRESSFVGGILFCFALHYISLIYPAHGGKIITITFLPLAFLFIERLFKSEPLINSLALGLVIGLMFHGGHPQILFYCGISMSVYFVFKAAESWKKAGPGGTLKLFGLYTAAFVIGALLYAVILLPAWEYKGFTHRGEGLTATSDYKFATSFSQPPEDMLYVPLRNPFGWGKDYGPVWPNTDGIFYRGRIGLRLSIDYFPVFGLALAAIGFIFTRRIQRWIFAALAGVVCFLALGGFNPLYEYVYRYVPGFSFFRIPYAIMIVLPVCLSALGAMGMDRLLDGPEAVRSKGFGKFMYALGVVTALTLLIAIYWSIDEKGVLDWLAGMQWFREMLWGQFHDVRERLSFFIGNLAWFVGLCALTMAVLAVYRKGWLKPGAFVFVAVLFILADTWSLGWDFVKTVPFDTVDEVFYKKTPAIEMMLKDKSEDEGSKFRVFALKDETQLMYYGLESATGYHPVKLTSFENLVNSIALNNSVLDLLNVRYFMTPNESNYDFRNTDIMNKLELVYEDKDALLYRLKDMPPRAYLVNKLIGVDRPEQALGIVKNPKFSYRDTAVIFKEDAPLLKIQPGADLTGQNVSFTHFEPDMMEIDVDAPADSLLVVSEIWYPGWNAYVDGTPVEIINADYALRGIPVSAGKHKVVMEFDPWLFKLGAVLSLATLAALLAVLGRRYYINRIQRTSGTEGAA